MKTIIALFNGIKFSHHVVDTACNKAKENEAEILFINLRCKEDDRKGYAFPSDITMTENIVSDSEAELTDDSIIEGNLKVAALKCESESIPYKTKVLIDPQPEEIDELTAPSSILVTSEESWKPATLTVESIDLKTSLENYNGSLIFVPENNSTD